MKTVVWKFHKPDGSLKIDPLAAINRAARACRSIPALLTAFAFAPAYADIYVWQEAGGAKRMSNIAPAWYSASAASHVRTQVLVNGHLIDDTGMPQPERDRLQATRAKAEARGRAPVPPAPVAAVRPPRQGNGDDAPPARTAAMAAADIPAKALEGFKSVFEAKKLGESLVEEMSRQIRPR